MSGWGRPIARQSRRLSPSLSVTPRRGYPESVIARWSRLENTGQEPFAIEQEASATWNSPQGTG